MNNNIRERTKGQKPDAASLASTPAQKFWLKDLEEIEGCFLEEGKKITDLPIRKPDRRVPNQGSVLLGHVINIDHVIKMPNRLLARLVRFLHPSF